MPANLDLNQLWAALETNFEIKESTIGLLPDAKNNFGCYVNNQWYILRYKGSANELLAIDILHNNIIEPFFKISNLREDNNIDFIGGNDAVNQIENKINQQSNWLGFTIASTSVEQIISTRTRTAIIQIARTSWAK